ncbi:MAG: LemA family protein [Bacteroidales bacterium]|nr:LemA family protein [Bacteroidales bacterium]
MKIFRIILACIIALPLLSSCGYNTMVEKREQVDAQLAQVDNVYQRRADLIPNLVNTVKGYAAHEEKVFQEVSEARTKIGSVSLNSDNLDEETLKKFQDAQDEMGSAISRLLMITENYPELKANENFMSLQVQLEGTENRITVERQKYNDAARDYNTYIKQFPRNFISSWFDFEKKPYFTANSGADKAPTVEF